MLKELAEAIAGMPIHLSLSVDIHKGDPNLMQQVPVTHAAIERLMQGEQRTLLNLMTLPHLLTGRERGEGFSGR